MFKSVVHRHRISPWSAVPLEEASKLVDDVVHIGDTIIIPVQCARTGHVLAEDICASKPHPEFRTSVKDGYAVIASDGTGVRQVISTTTAGDLLSTVKIEPGSICRVNTGSMIPDGADAVVQIEDTMLIEHNEIEEISVKILSEPRRGQDIREIGCDIAKDELLLPAQCVLGPPELGILAGTCRKFIKIYEKPKVAVISTGNELVDSASNSCLPGRICDTNRPQLIALLDSFGFKTIDMGIVCDHEDKLEEVFKSALVLSDVIVCSGGVSMGEKDYIKSVFQERFKFTIKFGRVRMKPGLPTTFACGNYAGRLKLIFALPGNPVSAYVTSLLFAVPALRKIGGHKNCNHTIIDVKLVDAIELDDRPEFRRARLLNELSADHIPLATCTDHNQASSRLLSMRSANLLLQLPARSDQRKTLKANEIVQALIISAL